MGRLARAALHEGIPRSVLEVITVSHGPQTTCGVRRDGVQRVVRVRPIRARADAPLPAIPVLDKGVIPRRVPWTAVADGPDIGRRERYRFRQLVPIVLRRRCLA